MNRNFILILIGALVLADALVVGIVFWVVSEVKEPVLVPDREKGLQRAVSLRDDEIRRLGEEIEALSNRNSVLEERLFECLDGIDRSTIIEGFSLDGSSMPGAGIYCENGSPTIRGNRISGFGWGINLRHSTALIEENTIEILSGLSAGDMIATSGVHHLREGMEIRRLEGGP